MQRYRNPALKQHRDHQIKYAPRDVQLTQISRAERLLDELNPAGTYRYPELCEKITTARGEMYPDLVVSGAEGPRSQLRAASAAASGGNDAAAAKVGSELSSQRGTGSPSAKNDVTEETGAAEAEDGAEEALLPSPAAALLLLPGPNSLASTAFRSPSPDAGANEGGAPKVTTRTGRRQDGAGGAPSGPEQPTSPSDASKTAVAVARAPPSECPVSVLGVIGGVSRTRRLTRRAHSAASSATPAWAWRSGAGGGGDDDDDEEEAEELCLSLPATSSTGHTLARAWPSRMGSDFFVPAHASPRKAMTRPPPPPALPPTSSQTKTREKNDSPRSSLE